MNGEPVGRFQRGTVSFVRRDDRLRPRHQRTWDAHHAAWVLDVPRVQASMSVAPGHVLDEVRDFGRVAPLVVEIGSGTGDAVVQGALARPGTNFLAVDVYRPGLASTVAKIVRHDLTNIRLVQADGMQELEHMLERGSAAEIWVFFADPWHKNRHHKRRLVNPGFAELAASRLAPGGLLRLATDWADYARQMRDVLAACGSLTNPHGGLTSRHTHGGIPVDAVDVGDGCEVSVVIPTETSQSSPTCRGEGDAGDSVGAGDADVAETGFAPRFEGRVMTQFEQKALAVGRTVYDLELCRTATV